VQVVDFPATVVEHGTQPCDFPGMRLCLVTHPFTQIVDMGTQCTDQYRRAIRCIGCVW